MSMKQTRILYTYLQDLGTRQALTQPSAWADEAAMSLQLVAVVAAVAVVAVVVVVVVAAVQVVAERVDARAKE